MTPDAVLQMLADWLDNIFAPDSTTNVALVSEGVILLSKSGAHVLIEAHSARLEVAS